MPQQLSPEFIELAKTEARAFAMYNYIHAGFFKGDIDDINTWPLSAQVSYHTLLNYFTSPISWPYTDPTLYQDLDRRFNEATELLSPLLEYGQSKEANIPLGASITTVILERAKGAAEMAEALGQLLKAMPTGPNLKFFHAKKQVENARTALAIWTAIGEADKQQKL